MAARLLTPEDKALVGRKSPWWLPPEPVGRSDLRRFAEATFNYDPVHYDESHARRSRWGTVIAPPTFVTRAPYGGLVIAGPTTRIIGPVKIAAAPRGVNGGNAFEIFRPVRLGDEVRQRARVTDLSERTGGTGPFVLLMLEIVYVDQHGEVLALGDYGTIYLPPREEATQSGVHSAPTSLPVSSLSHEESERRSHVTFRARPLVFEDMEVGRELPCNDYGVISSEMMVRYQAASENYEALHHDFLWCHEAGFKNVLLNGPLRNGLLATYLEQLAGEQGFIRRIMLRQRGMDYPGHALRTQGVITRKEVDADGLGVLDLDIWVENQKGERTTQGAATLILPRRGGPPVPTSFPCPRERVAWAFEE